MVTHPGGGGIPIYWLYRYVPWDRVQICVSLHVDYENRLRDKGGGGGVQPQSQGFSLGTKLGRSYAFYSVGPCLRTFAAHIYPKFTGCRKTHIMQLATLNRAFSRQLK